ncbi:unnamed protein product [Callosobruchus maculatus]|uniref:phosphatidylinositol-3,5-bisphosphate 3-phosphatase n=1 Tax=Callosobruchus maculatus TaxID=64391 RepID=A0A653C5S8_CALMS|nr:unnamed protein product [Callosobruchus maculatus]
MKGSGMGLGNAGNGTILTIHTDERSAPVERNFRLSKKTYSLWGYMANHLQEYLNPLYNPQDSPDVLVPNLLPQNIKFWRGMYCRFESGVHPREPQMDLLLATSDYVFSLDEHVKYLSKRISSVKSFISRTVEKKRNKSVKKQLCNNVFLDNKMHYEQGTKQLEAVNGDHPLNVEGESNVGKADDALDVDVIKKEIDSVAIDWKQARNAKECSCSLTLDQLSKKMHCRKCGMIFCQRCITKKVALPGHVSQIPVPVCKPCFDSIAKPEV